jgi:MscS family membrane protein
MGDKSVRIARSLFHLPALAFAVLTCALPPTFAQEAATTDQADDEQTAPTTLPEIRPVRTDSPRDTLRTFLRLRDSLETALIDYRAERSADGSEHIALLLAQFRSLIDLSQVAQALRDQKGNDINAYLLDIFGRVKMPQLANVPDADAFSDDSLAQYRIPGTPIKITRIGEGPREGEFLFNARSVDVAPRFYRGIEDLPLSSGLGITSWNATMPQITGPLIPYAVVLAMPGSLASLWLDTPVWKVIATISIALISLLLLLLLHRWLSRTEPDSRIGALSQRLIRPVSVLATVGLLAPFIDKQINTSGVFSHMVDSTMTALTYFSIAWLFWLAVRLFFEWIILSPRIGNESLDANLLRLVAGTFGIVGVVVILAYGGQELGMPVLSVLAGLGIGGLAIALAIKPTLENLIGGVVLYVDKPVRVGDFCSFGDKMGTVETIGIRSIQLRALDRTLITVPNAQFVDLELVNWAECDQLMMRETIGVRYETTPDQLRYTLAKLREMLQGHPRLNSKKVRVRFSGYGNSSLNIIIRVYAKTQEWDEFHAIREDILLRVYDVITSAGTGFAFPSHTIYMSKDKGLDEEAGKKAMEQVEAWRRSGQLPFPSPSPERLKSINDTLDYPPRGSPEASPEEPEAAAGAAKLSTEASTAAQTAEEFASQEQKEERRTDR